MCELFGSDAIAALGQWTSALITLVGLYFLWRQLQGEREVLEVQTSAQVYESGINPRSLSVFAI